MKLDKLVMGVCTLGELTCIGALAYIGLKRNKDAYETEIKYIDEWYEHMLTKHEMTNKDIKIRQLEDDNKKLKKNSGGRSLGFFFFVFAKNSSSFMKQ